MSASDPLDLVMMNSRSLALINSSQVATTAGLVDRVCTHWPMLERPQIFATTIPQVLNDESCLGDCGAAWIFLKSGTTDHIHDLIGLLQDCHIPVLLTRDNEAHPIATRFQDGVLIGPPDAPPLTLCAVLRTLWSQSVQIKELQTEVAILRAHQGGLCDQIDKIDEELRLAAQLQREFLPTELPQVDHLDIRVLYRPASYVSGDIYDIIRLDERHIGLFIADAVGHGVPAALMTMYIKRSLRIKEIRGDVDQGYCIVSPSEAIARLNHDIMDQQGNHIRTATACYGLLDTESHELTVARAGHPYPLLLRVDGSTEWIKPEGAMLGIFSDERFDQTTVKLNAGDRVLFYSDGFEVAFPEHDITDGRRPNDAYIDVFKNLTHGSVSEALHRLSLQLDRQAGSLNPGDDLTALLIGVVPQVLSAGTDTVTQLVAARI